LLVLHSVGIGSPHAPPSEASSGTTRCFLDLFQVLEAAIKSLGDQARDVDMAVDEKAGTSYGEPEQLLGVFDLRRLHPACVDFEFIVFLIDTIYRFYPQRLGQVLLVEPPPFVFEAAWAVIKPQLGRHADIVRFVSLRDLRREYFTADTLPPDFR